MNRYKKHMGALVAMLPLILQAQITVNINFSAPTTPISPLIYGRNNSLSVSKSSPLKAADWTKLKEAGVRFSRENGGNNCTKYNWRKKLDSHPDWYNNVYANDWDYSVSSAKTNYPTLQLMYGFQLLGKVPKTTTANFNDYGYNQSAWWQGTAQNLAGGGTVNPDGTKPALVEGNIDLYLQDWPADSTAEILNYWRSPSGLAIDEKMIQYWNMDNEVEIWNGTHDDVVKSPMDVEVFLQKYFAVAKAARKRYPNIKLVGPVSPNEWQWYNWPTGALTDVNNKPYSWLEYFIKRIAEEQSASGIRLLDVLDIHFYPSSEVAKQVLQYHRVYFDSTYVYPEANGVKTVNGGWDNSINKEMVFARSRAWLKKYMGANHGVTFSVSETDIKNEDPNVVAIWYASTLGEFMRNQDAALFCPWSWKTGMWEVMHLMSRYNQSRYVPSTSSEKDSVSAYTSISVDQDSATILLVNRSTTQSKTVNVNIQNFALRENQVEALQISGLPIGETFVSHSQNALKKSTVAVNGTTLSLTLPALSVTSLLLPNAIASGLEPETEWSSRVKLFPNPAFDFVTVESPLASKIEVLDARGVVVHSYLPTGTSTRLEVGSFLQGMYFVKIASSQGNVVKPFVKQ